MAFGASEAQTITRQGNTFVAERTATTSGSTETKYTYKDTDGETYKIHLSKMGHAYIIRTSKKSGKEYRKYLDEQTSRTICKEMGREYKEKATNK